MKNEILSSRTRTVGIVLALTWSLPHPARPAEPRVELLSAVELAQGTLFEGTCVGGLSALAYQASSGRYLALSDSGDDARLYTLDLPIQPSDEGPRLGPPTVERVVRLLTREGLPYPGGRVDPEGLALVDATTAFLSSEGKPDLGVPPFVDLVDVESGAHLASVAVPPAFTPRWDGDLQVAGVRPNQGFEALALGPGGADLHVVAESALMQDAPASPPAGTDLQTRWLHFRREGDRIRQVAEYRYPLRRPEGEVVAHGLVEILALEEDRFFALERTYAFDRGLTVRLFVADPPTTDGGLVRKALLLDFAEAGIELENYEGLALGPPLPDGGESLLVVGDNDDTACATPPEERTRPTRFLLFRLRR